MACLHRDRPGDIWMDGSTFVVVGALMRQKQNTLSRRDIKKEKTQPNPTPSTFCSVQVLKEGMVGKEDRRVEERERERRGEEEREKPYSYEISPLQINHARPSVDMARLLLLLLRSFKSNPTSVSYSMECRSRGH